MSDISQSIARELFKYSNGVLFWKEDRRSRKIKGKVAGHIDSTGYVRINTGGKKYLAHRIIYIYHYGDIFSGLSVDHINRVKNDNRIENLRLVTHQENNFNKGAKGYYFMASRNKYIAHIAVNGTKIHLGCYDEEDEAKKAYQDAKYKHHIITYRKAETKLRANNE